MLSLTDDDEYESSNEDEALELSDTSSPSGDWSEDASAVVSPLDLFDFELMKVRFN